MKNYYIKYWNDFGNTYRLAYAETDAQKRYASENKWEKITRKEAEHYCTEENARRESDENFAYYADNAIFPIDYNSDIGIENDKHYTKIGYIWERTTK
jgi:hypothetical protein